MIPQKYPHRWKQARMGDRSLTPYSGALVQKAISETVPMSKVSERIQILLGIKDWCWRENSQYANFSRAQTLFNRQQFSVERKPPSKRRWESSEAQLNAS